MEYQVPQFIEVEDKIFGPLTLKQFIYLAGGVGLTVILLLYLPFFIGILFSIPVAALSLALAFYKINGKTFIELLEAGFTYYIGRRLYLWKREELPPTPVATTSVKTPEARTVLEKKELTRRKLEELAWSLDVKDATPPQ